MVEHLEVRPGTYVDSVSLMQVSRTAGEVDGVEAALVAMATELNRELLAGMGFDAGEAREAGPNDLLVALRATDDGALTAGLEATEQALADARSGHGADLGAGPTLRTFRTAVRDREPDLALISVPGPHAYVEAVDALESGLNVMIFSDNVPLAQEVDLKRRAAEADRLVMGPDCGTALIGGIGLGFANHVRPGPVGVIAASGTGAQQVTCLLDDAGVGVSHVLGVGGRDLSAPVGAASTLPALTALDADPATELIVVVSKPPAGEVADRVREAARRATTPVVEGFVGSGADDLTGVVRRVLGALDRDGPEPPTWPAPAGDPAGVAGGALRGLFSGGTLCAEAVAVAGEVLGPVASNVSPGVDEPGVPPHRMTDLGADEFTRGRPHPMIDHQLRLEELESAAGDPAVTVLLLDVVLGHGAHPDPASELAPALRRACRRADEEDRPLGAVVSLCGAADDPQGRDRQAAALGEAGAAVHASNAAAARHAARLAGGQPR